MIIPSTDALRPAPGQRVFPFLELPLLHADDPCRGCGACCRHVGWPPHWHDIRDPYWERLVREHPELAEEIERAIVQWEPAIVAGVAVPCCWYDPTTRRCRNYMYRPDACRDFEPGEEDCRRFRAEHGID